MFRACFLTGFRALGYVFVLTFFLCFLLSTVFAFPFAFFFAFPQVRRFSYAASRMFALSPPPFWIVFIRCVL